MRSENDPTPRRGPTLVGALCALTILSTCGQPDDAAPGETGSPTASGDRETARAARLARDAAELRETLEYMEALELHDRVVDAVAEVLAGGDESTWRRCGGWAFRTFELGYWTGWARREQVDGQWRIPTLDTTRVDHPLHAIARYARALDNHGVDFLLVPIPSRIHVYPERLPGIDVPGADFRGIDLAHAEYMLALSEAGVEVLDLLPELASARHADPARADEFLYHAFDRHWTPRGAKLAAELIAAHVRELPWFEGGSLREGEDFVVRREKAPWQPRKKPGLPESEQAVELWLERVLRPGGEPFLEPDRSSPILVLGDSFLNHLQEEASDVASLLAAELRTTLDTIALPGGGSVGVWQSLARRGDGLSGKKLVIWLSGSDQLADPRLRFIDVFGE